MNNINSNCSNTNLPFYTEVTRKINTLAEENDVLKRELQ